jgi:hypothetical protein
MARPRLTPYDDDTFEALDLDQDASEYDTYRSTPSTAARDDLLPEDPMPLFLSGGGDAAIQPVFGSGTRGNRDRASVWPRIFKASIVATAAAGIALAILSMENPFALFANAKASLIGASAGPSSSGASAPAVQAAVNVRAVPMASAPPPTVSTPTRDEIAIALRTAHQSLPEIRQPPPAAAAPARKLDADELATLLKRARGLIAIGDIAPARLLLERAADAQEASAALLLAQTYDPAVLGTQDSRSITPDPAAARGWYQKAAQFGSRDAEQRLAQMQN